MFKSMDWPLGTTHKTDGVGTKKKEHCTGPKNNCTPHKWEELHLHIQLHAWQQADENKANRPLNPGWFRHE